jgi:lipoprotein signal peptidase
VSPRRPADLLSLFVAPFAVERGSRHNRKKFSIGDLVYRTRSITVIAMVTGGIVALDLGAKALAHTAFRGVTSGPVVPVENPEFSLGIARAPFPLMLAAMAVGIFIAGFLTTRAALGGRLPIWVPAAIVGGSLANLADRAVSGAVHDFLATPWMILNLADLAVFAGVCALAWHAAAARLRRPRMSQVASIDR